MVFKNLCLVLWPEVAPALEGLKGSNSQDLTNRQAITVNGLNVILKSKMVVTHFFYGIWNFSFNLWDWLGIKVLTFPPSC